MSETTETLTYARMMMDYGRYDVARRSLTPLAADDAAARDLLAELDALIAAQGDDANALKMTLLRPLDEAVVRVKGLDRGPVALAPRWHRRYVVETHHVETHHVDPQRAVMRIRSRAVSPYEWRYLPARATLTLTALDNQRTHIALNATSNRTYMVWTILSGITWIYLTLYVTIQDLSAACLIMFPVTFFTFYMVPTMMEHAKHVRDDLMEKVRAALADERLPAVVPPAHPEPSTHHQPLADVKAALLKLDRQLSLKATGWPTTLRVAHEAVPDGVRFRVQANPILFYHWAFMPPTLSGNLRAEGDLTHIVLVSQRRNDLLWIWMAAIFLLIAMGALLAEAVLIIRVIVLVVSIAALAANYAIAQLSMDARGAVLAQYVLAALQAPADDT